jgi:lysophospholipase L1-like esterase
MKKQSKKRKTKKNIKTKNNKVLIMLNLIQTALIIVLALFIWNTETEIKNIEKDKEKAVKEVKTKQGKNYVLLGDSITDWYPISDFFDDDTPIINSGFAGYKTKDLLNNLDETVYRYNPTKVFIQIGTNDLNSDDSNSEIAYDNILELIKEIKTNRPYAEIYLESIYPVNQDCEKTNKQSTGKRENKEIVKLNNKLKEYSKENGVTYLDMYNKLSDENGNLKPEYTYDGLHLNSDGYSKVSNEIKKCIEEN